MKEYGQVGLMLMVLFLKNQSKAEDRVIAVQQLSQETNFCQLVCLINGEEHRDTIDIREPFHAHTAGILIPDGGTNFLMSLNIAWIEKGTNNLPQNFKGDISLGAYSSTNETPQTLIGTRSWKINFDPNDTASNTAPFNVARSKLDKNRSIYFCQFDLLVPVKSGLLNPYEPPQKFVIWMTAGSELHQLWWWGKHWARPNSTSPEGQSPIASAKTNYLNRGRTKESNDKLSIVAANSSQTGTVFPNSAPVLGIALRDGYILINSLPATTNGTLEEANPETYPLVWQPAIESSNTPAGWQMPLKSGAKLFRLNLSNSQP